MTTAAANDACIEEDDEGVIATPTNKESGVIDIADDDETPVETDEETCGIIRDPDAEASDEDGGSICFPPDATVEFEDGDVVAMNLSPSATWSRLV